MSYHKVHTTALATDIVPFVTCSIPKQWSQTTKSYDSLMGYTTCLWGHVIGMSYVLVLGTQYIISSSATGQGLHY